MGLTSVQELAECCSERLGTMRTWIGVATLRSLEVQGIPEEMQAEPLNGAYRQSCEMFQTLTITPINQLLSFVYSIGFIPCLNRRPLMRTPFHSCIHY